MADVFLICTRHENLGKCNSKELYNIFERIQPEVIFEETPPTYFDSYYLTKKRRTLESDAIFEYVRDYNILNVPVDSDEIPDQSFFDQLQKLHISIERLTDRDGFNYRNFTDKNMDNAAVYGFQYLNSDSGSLFYREIRLSIESGLKTFNNATLDSVYKSWMEVTNRREEIMLKNIYNYRDSNVFDCAVFTIGAAHRESIIKKIKTLSRTEKINLNWKNI